MKNITSKLILFLSVLFSLESLSQKVVMPQKKKVLSQPKVENNSEYLTDQSGNTYKTVKIGSNVWMAENLKSKYFANGDKIQEYIKGGEGGTSIRPYFSIENNGLHTYSWKAVIDPRGIAPEGWHVPTKADWEDLLSNCKSDKDLRSTSGWPIVVSPGYYERLDCPNCKYWNSEYRRKVPCHKCQDSRKVQGKYVARKSINTNGNDRLKFNVQFSEATTRNEVEYWIRYWSSQYVEGSSREMYFFEIGLSYFYIGGSSANITSGSSWLREAMLPIRLVKNKPNQDYSEIAKGQPSESSIPVVKTKTLYFNNDQNDTTPKKSCSDFPFTLGCVNTKIGELNAKFFRGNRYGDMYNKQLENFLDNRGYFSNSKNELTRDTWEYLMNVKIEK